MNLPDKPVRMTVFSQPSQLPIVRAALEKMCQLLGFGDEATGGIVLAVDEALTNIIRHAYHGDANKTIEVELAPAGGLDALEIRLRDYGQFVDPSEIKSRNLADVRPGGLGVHIISNCMDHVEYKQAAGGGTVLTLLKRKAPAPARST